MDTCPHCNRKLITKNSPRCSWCGEVIADAQYLAEAKANREAIAAQERANDKDRAKTFDDFQEAKRASQRAQSLRGVLGVTGIRITGGPTVNDVTARQTDRMQRSKSDINIQIAIAEELKKQANEEGKSE